MHEIELRLARFLADQIENSATYFGYPEIPKNNDLSILGISGLAKLHLNNAGDPSVHGNARMHTKEFEKEVIDFIAELYGVEDYWGYITSGGTEGNLFGAYMGRDYFQQRNKKPYFVFSASSHYSIPKNAHILGIESLVVSNQITGEMDYDDLRDKVQSLIQTEEKIGLVINLNIGTTMTGAMDRVSEIISVLRALQISPEDVFIHADAALMGLIYPFLERKEDLFGLGVKSIALSGHKFPGTIHPCGVILADKTMHDEILHQAHWVPYVGSADTTISGSRNGFLALNFWYIIQKKGKKGFELDTKQCIENATYLYEELLRIDYPGVLYNRDQIIVVFDKPSEEIVRKYQLATEGNKAHVVVMQHIDKTRIDEFCSLMERDLAMV